MIKTESNEYIERLIDALIFSFRIPDDDSLVKVLGTGMETANQDAIRTWIQYTLSNPDMRMAETILPWLITRFEQTLNPSGKAPVARKGISK